MYSPGVSSVPARRLPHIAAPAPRHNALTMCPGLEMPPSASTGTPRERAYFATWYTAEACARPQAQTSCVVQMEPMPMPTLRASAPQSSRFCAWRKVTTFPATTCNSGNSCFIQRTMSCWKMLSPCELSTTTASTPAATSARTRSLSAGLVPTAAATRKCLSTSVVALGKSAVFCRSDLETRASKRPLLDITGNLPFLDSLKSLLANCKSTPSPAVTRCSALVMIVLTGACRSLTKSVSRLVTSPSNREPMCPSSVTGYPEKPRCARNLSTSDIFIVGVMHTGSVMKPHS
mmetsp:Transcript_28788/g.81805  ORF Transcript_28788/g.81805 Transcript_28788/m.81805 type:complete len:290 (+) Transcript_28788:473-1342(+)